VAGIAEVSRLLPRGKGQNCHVTISPREASATNYDQAETAYLGLVRDGRSADLPQSLESAFSAARAWGAAAYAEYFELKAAGWAIMAMR